MLDRSQSPDRIRPSGTAKPGAWRSTGLALIVPLLVGCMNQSFKGAWTYETKRNVLSSLTFECADLFLTEDATRSLDELPERIDERARERLRLRLQELLDDIASRHAARHERLSELLEQPDLVPAIRPRLVLTATGRPLAHVEADGSLTLDLLVLLAIFRSMVMTGVPEEGWGNYVEVDWSSGVYAREFDFTGFAPLGESEERARVDAFREFESEVEGEMGYCLVGDLFVDLFGSQWQEHAERTALLEQRLLGGLLFLLAHEVGHLVHGHLAGERAIDDRAAFQAAELQADRYAATLLGDASGALWAFGRQYRVTRTMRGFELFFQAVYGLVGFEGSTPEAGFDHPEARVRLQAAHAAYTAARASIQREEE